MIPIMSLAVLTTLVTVPAQSLTHAGFDLTLLQPIVMDAKTPAADRVAQGIAYLRQELATPSPPSWGVGGGPIDTGYIQQSITHAIAFPGADEPGILRKIGDVEPNAAMRDRLTIALAITGARDTTNDLIRIVRKEPIGAIRYLATIALGILMRDPSVTDVPKRTSTGPAISSTRRQEVISLLINKLSDPFKRYRGARKDERDAYYPIQEQSAVILRQSGYVVTKISAGWRLADRQGRLIRFINTQKE